MKFDSEFLISFHGIRFGFLISNGAWPAPVHFNIIHTPAAHTPLVAAAAAAAHTGAHVHSTRLSFIVGESQYTRYECKALAPPTANYSWPFCLWKIYVQLLKFYVPRSIVLAVL